MVDWSVYDVNKLHYLQFLPRFEVSCFRDSSICKQVWENSHKVLKIITLPAQLNLLTPQKAPLGQEKRSTWKRKLKMYDLYVAKTMNKWVSPSRRLSVMYQVTRPIWIRSGAHFLKVAVTLQAQRWVSSTIAP